MEFEILKKLFRFENILYDSIFLSWHNSFIVDGGFLKIIFVSERHLGIFFVIDIIWQMQFLKHFSF